MTRPTRRPCRAAYRFAQIRNNDYSPSPEASPALVSMTIPVLPAAAPRLPEPHWRWEQPDPGTSGATGNVAKLFRGVSVKKPGIMALDAPTDDATLLAREAIQNSWDAAIELRETWARPGALPPFEIRFRFKSATGEDRNRLISLLGLRELAERASSVDRQSVGLRDTDCLDHLADDSWLPYLVIEECAATGMYGPWRATKSKLYLALGTLGLNSKPAGSGGSFGFGKAGLIRGSATRTVVAYTCFEERSDDPEVTRRLMGMTYWDQHDLGDESFTGFGRLGELQPDGKVGPFENEQADRVAESVGLSIRSPDTPEQLGTTFLLIEPTVTEHDLVTAIERNWWPALEEDVFDAVVEGYEGRVHPRPRANPALRSFIEAYELATMPQDNEADVERRHYSLGSAARPLGSLGLVADRQGWSYPEQTGSSADHGVDHWSLVALIRKPRMVVEYLRHPQTRNSGPPYVRGVFVADDSINAELRDTEPPGHDAWKTDSPDGVLGMEQANLARAVTEEIRRKITDFRKSLKPPERPAEDIRLDFFDSLMRRVLRGPGSGQQGPTPRTRPVTVDLDYEPEVVAGGSLRLAGAATFSLSEHFDGNDSPARVTIRYRLVEDDTARDPVALEVEPPPGFSAVEGRGSFEGRLTHTGATFRLVSEPYRADWTGKLFAEAEPLGPETL